MSRAYLHTDAELNMILIPPSHSDTKFEPPEAKFELKSTHLTSSAFFEKKKSSLCALDVLLTFIFLYFQGQPFIENQQTSENYSEKQ